MYIMRIEAWNIVEALVLGNHYRSISLVKHIDFHIYSCIQMSMRAFTSSIAPHKKKEKEKKKKNSMLSRVSDSTWLLTWWPETQGQFCHLFHLIFFITSLYVVSSDNFFHTYSNFFFPVYRTFFLVSYHW